MALFNEIKIGQDQLASGQRELEAKVAKVSAEMAAAKAQAELVRLQKLVIKPGAPSKSSPSRASSHSAAETNRFNLKMQVLQHYGLLVSNEGADKKLWRARTMLHAAGADPLPLDACTLAHIWPAEYAWLASEIAAELALPEGFCDDPRNYLILPKDAHDGFDNESLIFLPAADGRIRVRKWRLEDRSPEEAAFVAKYHGLELAWPEKNATPPHMPIMRLMAFRMMCVFIRSETRSCAWSTRSRARSTPTDFRTRPAESLVMGWGRGRQARRWPSERACEQRLRRYL